MGSSHRTSPQLCRALFRLRPVWRKLPSLRGKSLAKEPTSFSDIAGKLHRLRIECTRCERKGRHSVANLIAQHGHNGNMSKWVQTLEAIVRTGMRPGSMSAAT
jgi:hypothetical protein